MIIPGNLTGIRIGKERLKIARETSATITINDNSLQSSADARGTSNISSLKSWAVDLSVFLTFPDFTTFFNSMKNGVAIYMTFSASIAVNQKLNIAGYVGVEHLSINSDRNNSVRISMNLRGMKRPKFSIEEGDELFITNDRFYVRTSDGYYIITT